MTDLLTESPPLSPEDDRLVQLYAALGRPSDDLPYSAEFDDFMTALRSAGDTRPPREVIQRLFRLRKAARLPRASKPSLPLGDVSAEDIELVEELLRERLGAVGSRDQLPYTDQFDDIWNAFRAKSRKQLDRHDFWRLVARVSK